MVASNKIVKGSCVYVNGVALTILSTIAVLIRRNGFRPTTLSTGDSITHCRTIVSVDRVGIVIKGGKPVHVYSPEVKSRHCERFTVSNGETSMFNARNILSLLNGLQNRINTSLRFGEYCSDTSGNMTESKDDNGLWLITVFKGRSRQPIGD